MNAVHFLRFVMYMIFIFKVKPVDRTKNNSSGPVSRTLFICFFMLLLHGTFDPKEVIVF